jgi:PAS domain S-box-containing protein
MDNTLRLAADKPLNPPIKGEDEIAHLDLVFRNMAQGLAEARRKERAVVDNAVDVICSVDEQGKFTAVNPAAHTSWGYTPDELLGKRLASIVFDEDISHTNNAIQRIIAEQEQSSFDNRILCKDGSVVDRGEVIILRGARYHRKKESRPDEA